MPLLLSPFSISRTRAPAPSKSTPSTKIIKHSVDTPADEALKYWTADKMRNAKPAPMPEVNALERGKQRPRRPSRPSHD